MAGLSSTFGYGATTNPWTDLDNAGTVLIAGANVADNHPVAMRHVLAAKAAGAKVAVIDPRLTNTAAQADLFARLRPGSDIALLGAIINHILQQRLYDRDYLLSHTNASYRVKADFRFHDGLFSGYNVSRQSYDTSSWEYDLDGAGRPAAASDLEAPGTVFSLLREHFARYDLDTAAAICGVPAATIGELAAMVAARRPLAILYALGITQHTTAVQTIRSYAILSLLLGSVGVAGGGVNALRGEANVQGSTDLGSLATHLPGYLPVPQAADADLAAYAARHGTATARHLAALLKAWFGDAAAAGNDWGYHWLPRQAADKPYTYIPMLEAMAAGQFSVALAVGINPVVSTPDNRLVTKALAALDLLTVVDIFPSETAEFWRLPDVRTADIGTEVLFLPAAHLYEKAGSLTSGNRWVQWQPRLLRPEGQAKPDLTIIDLLFRAVRRRYAGSRDPKDAPLLAATWEYGHPPHPEKVLKEIGGYQLAAERPLASLDEYLASPPGAAACGCWLYAGVYGDGNLARRREDAGRGGWGYAWPGDRPILYRDGNFATAEGVARLFAAPYASRIPGAIAPQAVSAVCLDGPLPEHYEPAESPLPNRLHPAVAQNPLVLQPLADYATGDFSYVLTTYAAPAGQARTSTVELSAALAVALGIKTGDTVTVASARGAVKARAAVSEKLRPLELDGKEIHTVAMPLSAAANTLTHAAADPTTGTPAAKTCLVDIRKNG